MAKFFDQIDNYAFLKGIMKNIQMKMNVLLPTNSGQNAAPTFFDLSHIV